ETNVSTWLLRLCRRARASARASARMSIMATLAPACASAEVIPKPTPEAAPETYAVLPLRSFTRQTPLDERIAGISKTTSAGDSSMKMADLFNVEGPVAFVTGAASGLGLAFAEVMAANGAQVVLADINEGELNKHVARLRSAGGVAEGVVLDVGNTDALRAAIDGAAGRHGRLDALFANAGISGGRGTLVSPEGAIDQFDVEMFKKAIDVNMTATPMAMRFAVAHLKPRKTRR